MKNTGREKWQKIHIIASEKLFKCSFNYFAKQIMGFLFLWQNRRKCRNIYTKINIYKRVAIKWSDLKWLTINNLLERLQTILIILLLE